MHYAMFRERPQWQQSQFWMDKFVNSGSFHAMLKRIWMFMHWQQFVRIGDILWLAKIHPYDKDRSCSNGFWKLSNMAYMFAGDWCRCLAELMMLLRADNDSSLNSLHSPSGGGRGVKLSDGSYSVPRSETGDTSAADPGQVFTLFACLSNQTRILTLLRSSQSFHKF